MLMNELQELRVGVGYGSAIHNFRPLEFGERRVDRVIDREVGVTFLLGFSSIGSSYSTFKVSMRHPHLLILKLTKLPAILLIKSSAQYLNC